jgi:hypothetical protein
MNRMHSSFKPWQVGLAALAMLLGTSLAAADGPAGPPPQDSATIEWSDSQTMAPAQSGENTEPVRLAWDRVGIMA